MNNQEQITTSNQDKSKDLTKVIFLKKLISDANDETNLEFPPASVQHAQDIERADQDVKTLMV